MIRSIFVAAAVAVAFAPAAVLAQPSAADFEPTPFFRDDFNAGGSAAPTGRWVLDAANIVSPATQVGPSFVSATPGTLPAAILALDPVASSSDSRVMVLGNSSTTNGTDFGLNYVICDNSEAAGTGDDFTALTNYRVVARVFLYGTAEVASDRWQVGPYVHAASGGTDLFRASAFYNSGATGGGPGFGMRGASTPNAQGLNVIAGTSALATGGWRLMSVMVNGDALAICVDANNDGTLDESDPAEYLALGRRAADEADGAFGFFSVGTVSNNVRPLLVDWVEVYALQAPLTADNWAKFE